MNDSQYEALLLGCDQGELCQCRKARPGEESELPVEYASDGTTALWCDGCELDMLP